MCHIDRPALLKTCQNPSNIFRNLLHAETHTLTQTLACKIHVRTAIETMCVDNQIHVLKLSSLIFFFYRHFRLLNTLLETWFYDWGNRWTCIPFFHRFFFWFRLLQKLITQCIRHFNSIPNFGSFEHMLTNTIQKKKLLVHQHTRRERLIQIKSNQKQTKSTEHLILLRFFYSPNHSNFIQIYSVTFYVI